MPDYECVCGKTFGSSDNLRHHQKYRCRPEDAESDVCRVCERVFKSYAGVRQHMRRAHPVEYNDNLQDEDRRVHRPWGAFENLQLARAEIAYDGYNINQHLLTLFPDRTLESIKGHRRSAEYRTLRDRIKAELEEAVEAGVDVEEAVAAELTQTIALDSSEPALVDAGPEMFEAGPPGPTSPLGNIEPVDQQASVLDDAPVPPPYFSPPPSPPTVVAHESDAVMDYIRFLLPLVTLDDEARTNVDRVCSVDLEPAVRRASITYLWNHIGLRARSRAIVRSNTNRREMPTFENRRKRYAYVQRLYKSDKSRLAEGLITDTLYTNAAPSFSAEETFTAYNDILGSASCPDNEYITDYVEHQVELYAPILIDELKNVLQARQSNARGPDGVRPQDLRGLPTVNIALLFNLVLFSSLVPDEWRANRTILIPKPGSNNDDLNTWRPLTISSAGLRIFNKILAARFSKLPLHQEQRGFRSVDGTLANTLTLQAIVKECREGSRPFSITTLDLRKAFDTVSHHSLARALSRFRINPKIRDLISDFYTDCSTVIDINGVSTGVIPIRRGVKQGDPLSPVLFNMILDETIGRLKKSEAGIMFNGSRFVCLAYADDLLIFTNNKQETQWAVRLLEKDLRRRGMALNPRKCSNITCNLLPSKSKLYVATRESIVVEGGLIRQLNVDEIFKYLGFNYGFMGARESSVDELPAQLERIIGAPLKPQQKLSLIKQYLIPRYIYVLQNPAVTLRTLSSADRLVRLAVKRALHLPPQTPNAALYAPPRQGGLGILSFRCRIPGILLSRLGSLAAERSDEALISACLTSGYVSSLTDKLGIWCRTYGEKSAQVASHWASKLETSFSGGGLWQVGAGSGSSWIDRPPLYWTGEEYIKSLQLRFNLLPTRGGLHNRSGETACRAGCARRETVCHVLQACPITHYERIRRHDTIVTKLASFARSRGLAVEVEPRFRDSRGILFKPDLLLKRRDQVLIADVAVNWEGPDVLSVSAEHKVARYSGPDLLAVISAKYPGCTVSVAPFILGARGGWCLANGRLAEFIGLTRSQTDLLVFTALKGGWLIHSSFSSRVWADVRR